MKASQTDLQPILEGVKQYVVPLFQRPYSWDTKEWKILLDDILELYHEEKPRTHFIGSIVTGPTSSVPEGISKYSLIDGQQRLTTIFLLFTALRDLATEKEKEELAEEINNIFLVNFYKKDLDHFKLLPTQIDREPFQSLIKRKPITQTNQIIKAYEYFHNQIKRRNLDLQKLSTIVTTKLSTVSIVLEPDDNPYLVFESLNAKGRPLTQADLIRNFFLMRVHVNEQEKVYNQHWMPMQEALKDNLTDYIGHYLMKDGRTVKQNDIYFVLKEMVSRTDALEYLKNLTRFAKYYQKLLYPEKEPNQNISYLLKQLNRIEVTTAYPFLLNCYEDYHEEKLPAEDFINTLKAIENFLIRRFVCGITTNELNKIFPNLYSQTNTLEKGNFPERIKSLLQNKGYPKDSEFKKNLLTTKLYGAGNRIAKTKLILESIENYYKHKEKVIFDNITIEHVMPQTINEDWKIEIGDDWETTHEIFLHTLGNLTLTGYNSELSNKNFQTKRKSLKESHLEINKYFQDKNSWSREDIEERAENLTTVILEIWPYFGDTKDIDKEKETSTKKTPKSITIMGEEQKANSWKEVFFITIKTIYELDPEKFDSLLIEFPHLIKQDKTKCRSPKELKEGLFLETHWSAKYIEKYCRQIISTCELSPEDWKIELSDQPENQ
jgi:uncharacterized protein with ParB-like and HNH nuclease domain